MTEDEEFEALDARIKAQGEMLKRLESRTEGNIRAMRFLESLSPVELSIYTLRRAFEVGYRIGQEDERDKARVNKTAGARLDGA
jgi:hypothetical protein